MYQIKYNALTQTRDIEWVDKGKVWTVAKNALLPIVGDPPEVDPLWMLQCANTCPHKGVKNMGVRLYWGPKTFGGQVHDDLRLVLGDFSEWQFPHTVSRDSWEHTFLRGMAASGNIGAREVCEKVDEYGEITLSLQS